MEFAIAFELMLLVGLLALSAFFSSSETSLFSLNTVQLEQMRQAGNPRVGLIESLLNKPRRLIVTILIGNELVNVIASVVSAALVIHFAGAENSWINVFIMVPVLLLFGEITPKTLAIRNNVAFASFQSPYIELFARIITPLRRVVRRVADYFITLIVGEERSRDNIITEDMVRSVATVAVGEGELDHQEAEYIHQIFELGEMTVHDVMTPRSQIVSLPATMPLREMIAELHRTRHSKVPIHDADKDSVVGILFARDLLALELDDPSPGQLRQALRRLLDVDDEGHPPVDTRKELARLLRKPYFVPETRLASDLFLTFRKRKLSIALVTDEFGGVTGLVTMEDLLECIFGDIPSGSEKAKRQETGFEVIGEDRYRVGGAMVIRQLNEIMGSDYADDDFDTVGGMLLHEFGEVPEQGARIVIGRCDFTVEDVSEQRIRKVLVGQATGLLPGDIADEPQHKAETD